MKNYLRKSIAVLVGIFAISSHISLPSYSELTDKNRASSLNYEVQGLDRERRLVTLIKKALSAEASGNLQDAEQTWERAANLPIQSLRQEAELAAYIFACLGRIKFLLDKFSEAESAKLKAINLYEATVGPVDLRTSFEYQALGVIYYKMKSWEKSEYMFEKALKVSAGGVYCRSS